jgi:hypothetical protein
VLGVPQVVEAVVQEDVGWVVVVVFGEAGRGDFALVRREQLSRNRHERLLVDEGG